MITLEMDQGCWDGVFFVSVTSTIGFYLVVVSCRGCVVWRLATPRPACSGWLFPQDDKCMATFTIIMASDVKGSG